jgi:hypothetical protein
MYTGHDSSLVVVPVCKFTDGRRVCYGRLYTPPKLS